MEIGNVVGAARVIRQTNPLAEVCGTACGPDAPCRRDCYRISFAGKPVEITELQRWVCQTAGAKGWPGGDAVSNRTNRSPSSAGDRPLSRPHTIWHSPERRSMCLLPRTGPAPGSRR